MKLVSAYIGGLLGLLMITATLLPSLHAFTHEIDFFETGQETKMAETSMECELCDFHFSSLDSPDLVEYNIHLAVKEGVYTLSLTETVYPFPNSLFSLRAPPAVVV